MTDETATTLCMLIRGRFRLHLSTGEYLLTNEGDYLMWGPGIGHLWHAEDDSIVLPIRWPSRPTVQLPDPPGDCVTTEHNRPDNSEHQL